MEPYDPLALSTQRLTLMPFSAGLMHLVLTDWAELERRLGARFFPRWHAPDEVDHLMRIRQAVKADPAARVWRIYFVLHNRDGCRNTLPSLTLAMYWPLWLNCITGLPTRASAAHRDLVSGFCSMPKNRRRP